MDNRNKDIKSIMTEKEQNLFFGLDTYFMNNSIIEILPRINNGELPFTLRYLDTVCRNENNNEYRSLKQVYGTKYFDPFRRSLKFDYEYADNKFISTSLAQMNFFKFLLDTNFLFRLIEQFNVVL